MKSILCYIIVFACSLSFIACKKDNYDPPSTTLSGRLVYNGEPIGVERDRVPYQLYQYGFGKVAPIEQTFSQDGSYSSLLFNGTYKMIIPNGQGPFLWKQTASGAPDSVTITLNGNQTLDLDVMPYYMIRNAQIAASGGNVQATFKVEKIITDANAKNIERVELFVNKTQFVSEKSEDRIAISSIDGASITDPNNISLSVGIPSISPTQNYVYARVGIKIADVEDRLYSQVVKLTF